MRPGASRRPPGTRAGDPRSYPFKHDAHPAGAGELLRRNMDKSACTGGNHLRFRGAAQPAVVQAVMIAFPMGEFSLVADPIIERVSGLTANSL